MLGNAARRDVPFFWSQHHDVTLGYVGHAEKFDAPEVHGDLDARDAHVVYRERRHDPRGRDDRPRQARARGRGGDGARRRRGAREARRVVRSATVHPAFSTVRRMRGFRLRATVRTHGACESSLLATLAACATTQPPPPAAAPPVAKAQPKPERFDDKVRQDFFDGMRGDAAALDRAQKLCEDTLAKNPERRRGDGLARRRAHRALARRRSRTGDRDKGMELYTKGTGEMDRAVSLAPTVHRVRIPRGAVYLAMAHFVPQPEQTKLVRGRRLRLRDRRSRRRRRTSRR